ncbi:Baculoviral Iap Repeat-Containing Protein 3 [Manis pentadactyla]|nr:Baculoviral Iap Repeat-Containing Protein 3 [Manis pentadactyla]
MLWRRGQCKPAARGAISAVTPPSGERMNLTARETNGLHYICNRVTLSLDKNFLFPENQLQDTSRYTVSNLSMQTHGARFKTFCNWPSSVPVHPQQLASAGFYYMGHSDDVKCFCCDGGLRCWESGDDPWVEHAKWFPRCEYLIRIKGQEFISQIQASYPHLLEQLLSTSDNPEDENTESPIIHFGPGENHSEDAVMMNTPVVKAALEMGFNRRLVKQTVQSKILTTGENYKTISDLVLDLLNAEDEIREEEKERATEEKESDDLSLIRKNRMALFQQLTCVLPVLDSLLAAKVIDEEEHDVIKEKTQTSLQARGLIDTILVKGNFAASIFKNSLQEIDPMLFKHLFVQQDIKYIPTEEVSDLPVEEQLRRLQEERTCKVCMDQEVSVVFIPCGHLVVCKDCAPSLRKCPICRALLLGWRGLLAAVLCRCLLGLLLAFPQDFKLGPPYSFNMRLLCVVRNDSRKLMDLHP